MSEQTHSTDRHESPLGLDTLWLRRIMISIEKGLYELEDYKPDDPERRLPAWDPATKTRYEEAAHIFYDSDKSSSVTKAHESMVSHIEDRLNSLKPHIHRFNVSDALIRSTLINALTLNTASKSISVTGDSGYDEYVDAVQTNLEHALAISKMKDVYGENASLRAQNDDLEKDIVRLKSTKASMEATVGEQWRRIDKLEREKRSLSEEIQGLRDDLSATSLYRGEYYCDNFPTPEMGTTPTDASIHDIIEKTILGHWSPSCNDAVRCLATNGRHHAQALAYDESQQEKAQQLLPDPYISENLCVM